MNHSYPPKGSLLLGLDAGRCGLGLEGGLGCSISLGNFRGVG